MVERSTKLLAVMYIFCYCVHLAPRLVLPAYFMPLFFFLVHSEWKYCGGISAKLVLYEWISILWIFKAQRVQLSVLSTLRCVFNALLCSSMHRVKKKNSGIREHISEQSLWWVFFLSFYSSQLQENSLTELPLGIFDSLTALETLYVMQRRFIFTCSWWFEHFCTSR